MAIDMSVTTQSTPTSALNTSADQLLARAKVSLKAPTPSSKEDAKIEKAGKDFESILLGSWLTQAEQSFAKVPGGDGEEDDDSSKDQFQGIAMQALAGSLTASGGIGIAKMITQHLHSDSRSVPQDQASNETSPAVRPL